MARREFNKEELKLLKVIKSPPDWAEAFLRNPENPKLHLKLRWYQRDLLTNRERKKSVRASRRIGKTVTMCIDMLWKGVCNKNRIIVCVTPYQSQIDHIFDIILKLAGDSPLIRRAIKSTRRAPQYKIEFTTGSIIKGFTAGTRSGQKGEGVRGQDCTDLYYDEVDYMGYEAIEAIRPMELSRDWVEVWASSTPTGKREQFYNWCKPPIQGKDTNRSGFKTFHYPVTVHPNWGEKFELEIKADILDDMTFEREYMAEFGEEAFGVFNQAMLDACLSNYRYMDWSDNKGIRYEGCTRTWNPENIYLMGVDWNSENVGTRIVIIEYHTNEDTKEYGKFKIFLTENIKKGPLDAIDRVIDLARLYRVSRCFLDHGYGHTNDQVISREVMGDKAMYDVFRSIDFGGKVEVRDPITKKKVLKEAKPFIVNSAARVLEEGRLILPKFEDERVGLVGQMRSYVISKIGPTGRPTYTDDNEDTLIAFMLAIHAFILDYADITKKIFGGDIEYNKNFVRTTDVVNREIEPKVVHQTGQQKTGVFKEVAQAAGLNYTYKPYGNGKDEEEVYANRRYGSGRTNIPGPPRRENIRGSGKRSNF